MDPDFLKIYVKARAVKGLMKPELAEANGTSPFISNAISGQETAYCDHAPEHEAKETLFPIQLFTFSPLASTTFPEPSIPQTAGKDLLRKWPCMKALSEGLTVEASTFTKN